MTQLPSDIDRAELAIRTYLRDRPHAADTLEGIHAWWLDARYSRADTAAALERLAAAGVIEAVVIGGRPCWSVVPPRP
jgi:hypothetical protein